MVPFCVKSIYLCNSNVKGFKVGFNPISTAWLVPVPKLGSSVPGELVGLHFNQANRRLLSGQLIPEYWSSRIRGRRIMAWLGISGTDKIKEEM